MKESLRLCLQISQDLCNGPEDLFNSLIENTLCHKSKELEKSAAVSGVFSGVTKESILRESRFEFKDLGHTKLPLEP